MSGFTPKEKLSAYQRWQLDDFEDEPDAGKAPSHNVNKNIKDSEVIAKEAIESYTNWQLTEFEDSAPTHAPDLTSATFPGTVIPKEKLTAYQRWELAAFDEMRKEAAQEQTMPTVQEELDALNKAQATPEERAYEEEPAHNETPSFEVTPEPTYESAIMLPTAAEIEKIHDDARAQGYAEGHAEGLATAQSAMQPVLTQVQTIVSGMEEALRVVDQQVAEKLLNLAIGLAEQVMRQSIKVKPEIILPVVQEAMNALNAHAGHPILFVSTQDSALVRKHLGEQITHHGWKIMEDAEITPGGCRIELSSGEVDALLETRWQRVIESLGISSDWLDEHA